MNKQVSYYNGVSSAEHLAEVKLHPGKIDISYLSNFERFSIVWHQEEIHKPGLTGGNKLILRYGKNFPYQSIEINDPTLAKEILTRYELETKSKKYSIFSENGAKGILFGIAVFIGVFLLFYKAILPNLAEAAAIALPISYEEKIGNSIKESLISQYTVDSVKTKALQSFYDKLRYESEYNINLTVVDYKEQNAFATPGGNIVVFSGIIDHMECPEELAALLGHELTHVNNKHSTKSIFRSLANYIALSVILNDVNGITSVIIDNANSFNELSYSRNLEQEADENAVRLMRESNINTEGMLGLLEQLNEIHDGDIDIPEFLLTHPITQNRIDYVTKLIEKEKTSFTQYPNWNEEWEILTYKDPFFHPDDDYEDNKKSLFDILLNDEDDLDEKEDFEENEMIEIESDSLSE